MSHRTVRTLLLLVATCAAALVFPGASKPGVTPIATTTASPIAGSARII